MPTFKQDLKLGTKVPLVKTDDIDHRAVTTDKLADGSVTTPKLADGSVTADKLAKNLVDEVASLVSTSVPAMTNEDIDRIMDMDGDDTQ